MIAWILPDGFQDTEQSRRDGLRDMGLSQAEIEADIAGDAWWALNLTLEYEVEFADGSRLRTGATEGYLGISIPLPRDLPGERMRSELLDALDDWMRNGHASRWDRLIRALDGVGVDMDPQRVATLALAVRLAGPEDGPARPPEV